MLKQHAASAIVWVCTIVVASAQDTAKVDFARDVQPLFKTHCIECHGPKQQKNGFRLDRRGDAMRGGTIPMITPGTSETSRLYLRLIGANEGMQMPPDGTITPEEIKVIKAWIDQGAKWPDALAGDAPATPPNPQAARLMETLRDGDRPAFEKLLRDDPKAAKLKGSGGTTPLMYAALYGDADALLIKILYFLNPSCDQSGLCGTCCISC